MKEWGSNGDWEWMAVFRHSSRTALSSTARIAPLLIDAWIVPGNCSTAPYDSKKQDAAAVDQ
jgi:hypothetical protein